MNGAQIITIVFLCLTAISAILTGIGVLVMRGPYDKIHYLSVVGIVGTLGVVVAVLVQESLSQGGVKTILVGLLLLITDPVLTHTTARAVRAREAPQHPEQPGPSQRVEP